MSDLTDRIEQLELTEQRYNTLVRKVENELGEFLELWDTCDPDKLPKDYLSRVNMVRYIHNFVVRGD